MIEIAWDRKEQLTAILEYMRKHGLAISDLIEYGGEDFRDLERAKTARAVERVWEMLAASGANYAKLEDFLGIPVISSEFPRQTPNRKKSNS